MNENVVEKTNNKNTLDGVIYILVNPIFPNLVKIGYTQELLTRLRALNSSSGLPTDYHVYAIYKVREKLGDLKLHKLIDTLDPTLRYTENREFYTMSAEKAYSILSLIAGINGDANMLERNPLHDEFFADNGNEKDAITSGAKSSQQEKTPASTKDSGNIFKESSVQQQRKSTQTKTEDFDQHNGIVEAFNVSVACEVGPAAAALLHEIYKAVQCERDNKNNQRYHDGCYWARGTQQHWSTRLPWASEDQIHRMLKRLLQTGYLISGCFNHDSQDRTIWYTYTHKTENAYTINT